MMAGVVWLVDSLAVVQEGRAESGSREFHAGGTAVDKVHDAKCEATSSAGFDKRKADDDRSCLAG